MNIIGEMAEIGLVASILSVAAFGASVATTLYQTGDVIIHSRQQITSLARHVTESTAALKHVGQAMEQEKSNCSKEMRSDIRKMKHSCRNTFEEIKDTISSNRSRRLAPFRWLFKRTKAAELEARLNSQKSTLQCMIQTLTVSKLGSMESRYV